KQYTDFPFLITLKKDGNRFVADRFLHAKDIGRTTENGEWKPVLINDHTGEFSVPNGTIGARWEDKQKWNLRLEDEETNEAINPRLTMLGNEEDIVRFTCHILPVKGRESSTVTFRRTKSRPLVARMCTIQQYTI